MPIWLKALVWVQMVLYTVILFQSAVLMLLMGALFGGDEVYEFLHGHPNHHNGEEGILWDVRAIQFNPSKGVEMQDFYYQNGW